MEKFLFNTEISGWDSWGHVFQSIELWQPLVDHILQKENLPVSKIENLHPGTNAVFKSGNHVVKIFAPKESGIDGSTDFTTEVFALDFAQSNGVSVSKLTAYGEIKDKYDFSYMILDHIDGVDFHKYSKSFTDSDKFALAKRLRLITDSMNKPCKPFNEVNTVKDAIHDKGRWFRWEPFNESFKRERIEYIENHTYGENVFVHGDLCFDNFIIDNKDDIFIIDFADSVLAPQCYEHAHLVCELFRFDKAYLKGFFGDYKPDELADLCIEGILIHDFGGDIVSVNIAKPDKLDSLSDLKNEIYQKLTM